MSHEHASPSASESTARTGDAQRRRRAGAFDIRTFIATLIGLYGIVLVIVGLFGTSQADLDKAGGLNINLWAGLGMIVAAAGFLAWVRLRPTVVPVDARPETSAAAKGEGTGRVV